MNKMTQVNQIKTWIDLIKKGSFELIRKDSNYFTKGILKNNGEEIEYSDLGKLLKYFLENTPFDFNTYLNFLKKLDATYLSVFRSSKCMEIFANTVIYPTYFDKNHKVKANLDFTWLDREKIIIFMYCIHSVVQREFDYHTQDHLYYLQKLNKNLYESLVSYGDPTIGIEVVTTTNEYFMATSNNFLASINILVFEYKQENYKAVLDYLNELFEQGFPKNHSLKFEIIGIPEQEKLGIPQLVDCGANRFFNSAASFLDLHEDILRYIKILGQETRYIDLGDNGSKLFKAVCFATYGLLLEDLKYLYLFVEFLEDINIYETYDQNNLPTILLDRHGVTNESVRAYLKMLEYLKKNENFSYEYEDFFLHFNNPPSMKILVEEAKKYDEEAQQYDDENKKYDGDGGEIDSSAILISTLARYGSLLAWCEDKYAILELRSPKMIALYRELSLFS